MSKERIGTGNPKAKNIVWYGKKYTKGQFKKIIGDINSEKIQIILNSREDCYLDYDVDKTYVYEPIICPHCGLISPLNKKPSSFKRWHFDNCRSKT